VAVIRPLSIIQTPGGREWLASVRGYDGGTYVRVFKTRAAAVARAAQLGAGWRAVEQAGVYPWESDGWSIECVARKQRWP
jgi:hypothetical protein